MKIIKFEPFAIIFKAFIEKGLMEEMINEDPTFSANIESYKSNLKTLMENIEV